MPLGHNIYVFPPFVLFGPLLRYFVDQDFRGALTLVVPDLCPRRFWWALLRAVAVDRLLLGRRGDGTVLLLPSRFAPVWSLRTLQWDLMGLPLRFPIFIVFFQVSQPWKPTRRCGSCLYPNDVDATFCHACGVATTTVTARTRLVQQGRDAVDERAIQKRFHSFKSSVGRKPYQRQKSALEQQFSTFLASVFPPKTISSCTADDVVRFLIHKDKSGRTVVHASDCSGLPCE